MNARSNRITGSLLTALLFLGAQRAVAHDEPTGCTTTGLAFGVAVFRADGTTPVAAMDRVSPCETIQYQFAVQYRAGTNDCDFQGGTMILETPDGVFHDTTPAGGVPLLGPDGNPNLFFGTNVTYTVRSQDIVGGDLLAAAAYYGCGCPGANFPPGCQDPTAHTGTPDTVGFPTGSTGIPRTVTPCPARTACQNSFCNPTKTDGIRTGLCDTSNEPDSTPCTDTDNNACTRAGCEAGSCVQTHVVKHGHGCLR